MALGAAPHLERQDFPFESDVYPFPFNLEPLSRASLAKYVYCEAPAEALRIEAAATTEDRAFLHDLHTVLRPKVRINHIGSLYAGIIAILKELPEPLAAELRLDRKPWLAELERIKSEGEADHYHFFRALFMGRHPGFGGVARVWERGIHDAAYPAVSLPVNPTALAVGKRIGDPMALGLAWLGDLHYWTTLCLLDLHYRTGSTEALDMARAQMMGPLRTVARQLAARGSGMPFDPLSVGYAPGATCDASLRFVLHLVRETDCLARSLAPELPDDYPADLQRDIAETIEQGRIRLLTARL
jgi:hypothetical protein